MAGPDPVRSSCAGFDAMLFEVSEADDAFYRKRPFAFRRAAARFGLTRGDGDTVFFGNALRILSELGARNSFTAQGETLE